MNCEESKNLWGPYHDGELDATLSDRIQGHLEQCPACRQFYTAQKQFEMSLMLSLKNRQATPAFWRQEEAAIRAGFAAQAAAAHAKNQAEAPGIKSFITGLTSLLWPNPQFYAGLATIWIALLGLNWTMDTTPAGPHARATLSTPHEQAELAEQRKVFQSLLMANEQSLPEQNLHSPTAPLEHHKPVTPKSPKAEIQPLDSVHHPATMLVARPLSTPYPVLT